MRLHERGEPQAMVEALVAGALEEEFEFDSDILRQLLLLPCFGRLQVLDCHVNTLYEEDVEEYLGILASMFSIRRARFASAASIFPIFGTHHPYSLGFNVSLTAASPISRASMFPCLGRMLSSSWVASTTPVGWLNWRS